MAWLKWSSQGQDTKAKSSDIATAALEVVVGGARCQVAVLLLPV